MMGILVLYPLAVGLTLTFCYRGLRNQFNQWDREGYLTLTRKETCVAMGVFGGMSVILNGAYPLHVLLIINFNLVVLLFLAFIDMRTKMLYVTALYGLFIGNALAYGITLCLGEEKFPQGLILSVALSYIVLVGLFCFTNAIAKGDAAIYISLLPIILMLEPEESFRETFLLLMALMIPLMTFTIMEGIALLWRKYNNELAAVRRPFAPYLCIGFASVLILDISSR